MPLPPNADFFPAVAAETRDSLSDSAFTGEFAVLLKKMPTLNDTNSIWKTDTPSYCVGRQSANAQQVVNDKQFGETK